MDPFNQTQQKRPTMLLVLAILTFINSGVSFFAYLFLSFATNLLPQIIDVLEGMGQPDAIINMYREMVDVPGWKFLLSAGCYALSIVGAAYMLIPKKVGLHIYIIAQILLFCVANFVIAGSFKMNITGAFWSLLFILLYALQFKAIKKQEDDNDPMDEDNFDSEN